MTMIYVIRIAFELNSPLSHFSCRKYPGSDTFSLSFAPDYPPNSTKERPTVIDKMFFESFAVEAPRRLVV